MTIGEKIQFYRKRDGLSQEDLGQKLLVSRQTISLWEMDKTLPTIDNLRRLKEIFSVSIDDILSESDPIEKNDCKPKESYVFKYDQSDLQDFFKKNRLSLIKHGMIGALICIIPLVYYAVTEGNEITIGLVLGCFLIIMISHFKTYFSYRKSWKASESKLMQNSYAYDIFDGYFILTIFRNEEVIQTQKIYFDDIEKAQTIGNFLVLRASEQDYIIKKNILIPESAFAIFCRAVPVKKSPDKLKTISILLFVLSICTMWGGLAGANILSGINHATSSENMWVLFLFLPIPIASIVFGFYLKKKGYKYLKNIIVGLIMTMPLCLFGSFPFLTPNIFSHSDKPILDAEQVLHIDIPQHSHITTQDWSVGTQSVARRYIYFTSDIHFDDSAVEDFEKQLANDDKWLTYIPNDLIGITSSLNDYDLYDYALIYNVDTAKFNTLPSRSGKYRFINILYELDKKRMRIVEYDIYYTK